MGSNGEAETVTNKMLLDEIQQILVITTKTSADIAELKTRIVTVKYEVGELEEKVVRLNNDGAKVEDRVEDLERYSSKNNLIISGIPYDKNEEIYGKVKMVVAELELTLYDYDICTAHHLPARNGVPDIIVKLLRNDTKVALIITAKKKHLEVQGISVYLDDHLLPSTNV